MDWAMTIAVGLKRRSRNPKGPDRDNMR